MKKKSSKVFSIPGVLLTIIASLMQVVVAFLMKLIIDSAMEGNSEKLKKSIFISLVYIVIYFLVNYLKEFFIANYLKVTLEDLKNGLYDAIMVKDYKSFYKKDSGEYISKLTNDVTALEENYYKSKFIIIQSLVTFIFAVISLFIISWKFAIGVLVISVLFMFLSSATGMGLNELRKDLQKSLGEFTGVTKDLVGGYEVIRAFNAHKRVRGEFLRNNEKLEKYKFKFNLRMGVTRVVNENLVILIVFSVMTLGSYLVISGDIMIGALLAVIQLLNSIMMPINILLQALNNSKSTLSIREEMSNILALPEVTNKIALNVKELKNEIKIKDLSFSYDNIRNVVHDLNLTIKKGKKYAIIGESGCGKSTLLKLMQNYFDEYEGEISLDDTNYKNINGDSFFNIFSVTHQNVFMFKGTIRDNITLFSDISKEKLENVVKISGLEKVIKSLPNGLDTMIEENGSSLSGGEKQRISLARALIRNSAILVLDEFTSALDKETAKLVEKEVLSIKDQTIITVTHRLSDENMSLFDFIIHMKNGKIHEIIDLKKKEYDEEKERKVV